MSGKPEWATIYEGYASAVDWPMAVFFGRSRILPESQGRADGSLYRQLVREVLVTHLQGSYRASQRTPAAQPWLQMVVCCGALPNVTAMGLVAQFIHEAWLDRQSLYGPPQLRATLRSWTRHPEALGEAACAAAVKLAILGPLVRPANLRSG